jgi:predicted ATP-dependent endonuclease of OLD family
MQVRLDQITVRHFKRIEQLTINLKPVTALVGGNYGAAIRMRRRRQSR